MIALFIASLAFSRISAPFELPIVPSNSAPLAPEIPVKAPDGWKVTKQEGALVMVPADLGEGKIYTVIVTPLQTKAGPVEDVYDIAKKTIGEVGTYTPKSSVEARQSDGGWDYRFSIGTVEKDGKGLLAEVMAVKKGDVGGVIIVLSESVDTMVVYSDVFANMIRSLGGAAKPPPAPTIAVAAGTVDLQYSVPAGWTESKREGATVIEALKDEFYTKYRWTLVVMPSQPLTGSLREHFNDYWAALVTANYTSAVVPLPLMSRLPNGNVCAFDSEGSAVHKTTGAKPAAVSVYLIAQGDRFVPILLVGYGFERPLEADLNRFIETSTIPGASAKRSAMFTKAEVAGTWSESSTSFANYVSASGAYAGDASIAVASEYVLRADGTYHRYFMALRGSTHYRENEDGTWAIDDNNLVLTHKGGTTRYSLLGYGADPKAGRFLVLGTYSDVKAKISFASPRGAFQATWYKSKKLGE